MDVDKYRLNNGLRIVTERMPNVRSVSFGIWVKTGSRHERPDNNGISHLIEHMLFKGTERYSVREIAEIFDGLGGYVNAFTSKEYTCYHIKVLDEHFPVALDVLSDMYFHSVFDEEELEKEKRVIAEEIAMVDDTPDDLVHELLSAAAYGKHSLAFPILGTEASLQQIGPETLRQFMGTQYGMDHTVISMAGNVDPSMLERVEQAFGSARRLNEPRSNIPPKFIGDALFQRKDTEQNHVCLSFEGFSVADPRLYALTLLNNAIGGGMSSRLFQEIRENRGWAYSVFSYHAAHEDSGLFTIYAGTAPEQTGDVVQLTMDILEDFIREGMTESELSQGKKQLKGSLILGLESTNSRMNRMGKDELMLGKHESLNDMIEKIDRVSREDICAVSRTLLEQPFAVALVGRSDKALSKIGRDRFVQSAN